MAESQNFYTGDGSSVLFSFTFPYLDADDIKVAIGGVLTTEYTLDSPTTVRFNVAPADGASIRIYRLTDTSTTFATFYAGSAIRSVDLNNNFEQGLFVAQEAQRDSSSAADAFVFSQQALATSLTAVSTAEQASDDAASANNAAASALISANDAVSSADIAVTKATDAENTANAAAALVATANLPTSVPDVASIPSSPAQEDLIEVNDSTGIESYSPLTGVPDGFVGEPGIAVKLLFGAGSWQYLEYRVTDPDSRYSTPSEVNTLVADGVAPANTLAAEAKSEADSALATANAALSRGGGTMSGQIVFAPGQSFGINTATDQVEGIVLLSDATDSTNGDDSGTAATPKAVKSAYDRASVAVNTASSAAATAASAQSDAADAQAVADNAQATANSALVAANTKGPDYTNSVEISPNVKEVIIGDMGSSFGLWDRMEIIFRNLNTDGENNLIVQIGDSSTIQTDGYQSSSSSQTTTAASTKGFAVDRVDSSSDTSGVMTLHWIGNTEPGNGEVVSAHSVGDAFRGWSGGGFMGQLEGLGAVSRVRIKPDGNNKFTKGKVVIRVWKYSS